MAITQDSLTEEVLSRQERAVVRGIYRASRLAEAIIALDKVVSLQPSRLAVSQAAANKVPADLRAYLLNQIDNALVSTKVPAFVPVLAPEISQPKSE